MGQPSRRVILAIEKLFPPAERRRVAESLAARCSSDLPLVKDDETIERIQLAVVKLTGGDASSLDVHLRIARVDWRDTLVAAGFGNDLLAHRPGRIGCDRPCSSVKTGSPRPRRRSGRGRS